MPAYFSIVFELNKTKTAIQDFCVALSDVGLAFKSGILDYESDSFADIIAWNQNKLDHNFALGYTENSSHDYKQMKFDFCDFTEVRVFVLNDKKSSTFEFFLIVPEDDFLEYRKNGDGYVVERRNERMDLMKSLAKRMWGETEILAVQTEWEGSDRPPKAKQISHQRPPQTEPFCIVSNLSVADKLGLPFEQIERGGVLIEACDNWNY